LFRASEMGKFLTKDFEQAFILSVFRGCFQLEKVLEGLYLDFKEIGIIEMTLLR
jgi:hypothetical protein